ncbi:MAG TPA: hypothetical protein VMU17_08145, partial [Elusimicrobiota bacterium]|nr:hypothetical protein [Elusimicrobiota bacterium]
MISLFTGSFRELHQQFIEQVQNLRAQNPLAPLLVVSPSGHLLTRLQKNLAAHERCCLNIHFLTFYAVAERLLIEAPPRQEPVVTEPA